MTDFHGAQNDDYFSSSYSNDVLFGYGGNDHLHGEDGMDEVRGGADGNPRG
jgi:Ca2+-binding RTX toxin-like protein